jgi:hypothetical protein
MAQYREIPVEQVQVGDRLWFKASSGGACGGRETVLRVVSMETTRDKAGKQARVKLTYESRNGTHSTGDLPCGHIVRRLKAADG